MFIVTPCILNHLVNKAPHMLECPPLVGPGTTLDYLKAMIQMIDHRTEQRILDFKDTFFKESNLKIIMLFEY